MRVEGALASDGDLAVRLMRDERSDYELMSAWLTDDRVLEFYDGRDHPLSVEGPETSTVLDHGVRLPSRRASWDWRGSQSVISSSTRPTTSTSGGH
jgi:hypothetical protein